MKKGSVSSFLGVLVLTLMFGFSVFMVSAQEDNPTSKQEISDFQREMKDLMNQAKTLLKDLKKTKGTEEWQQTIQEVVTSASSCASKILTLPSDEKRSYIDDCRGQGLWDSLNEIREEFVPPQDIKNALNDMKRQTKDLERFKKLLTKVGADVKTADDLIAKIGVHKAAVGNLKGKDLRDELQEFWSNNYWDEINKIRVRTELPKELKDISKELKFLEKDLSSSQLKKAFPFFGLDSEQAKKLLEAKKASITQIQSFLDAGDYDAAGGLLQEDVHDGWHPGDLRHFVGMVREAYERMKNVKDDQILDQILTILDPIAESFASGDVRDAKEAMIQFTDQMRKYENLFQPYYRGGVHKATKKTQDALGKLEDLISEKLKKGELKAPKEEGDTENGDSEQRPPESQSMPSL